MSALFLCPTGGTIQAGRGSRTARIFIHKLGKLTHRKHQLLVLITDVKLAPHPEITGHLSNDASRVSYLLSGGAQLQRGLLMRLCQLLLVLSPTALTRSSSAARARAKPGLPPTRIQPLRDWFPAPFADFFLGRHAPTLSHVR